MIEQALKRIDTHLCRYRTFPWQRNWAVFGGVHWQSQNIPWVPSLFLPSLVTSNRVVDGDCETFTLNEAGEPVAFGKFRMDFFDEGNIPATGTLPKSNQTKILKKLGDPGPNETSSSLFARRLLGTLNGEPLSKFMQMHFLAMALGFSTFFYLETTDIKRFREALMPDTFLKAIRDAAVKASELLEYSGSMTAITGAGLKTSSTKTEARDSIFGLGS